MGELPERPASIFDREREWSELARIWRRPAPDLVFVLGRRRAGKSFLLGGFARAVGGLYYQATKRTENEQLARVSALAADHFDDPGLRHAGPFPDWEAFFRYLTERARTEPLLLVLDEFPFLSAAAPALPSVLQAFWDHEWRDTRIKVILSGSHISAMKQLEAGDQPLYGRRTSRIAVDPFDYAHASEFVKDYSFGDRLRTYGAFGGLPGHLALLEPGAPLGRNIASHALVPSGRLVDDAQHMLDAFLADAQVHYSVIAAIAGGERTWSGITKRVGRDGGSLTRALQWLMEMKLIERVVPVTEADPTRSKQAIYRITDPYLTFWHRFVAPLISSGAIGLVPGENLWHEQVEPAYDDYMGEVFESVCRSFARRPGALPFQPVRVGEWWDRSSQQQIDLVALGGDGEVLVGECKWGRVRSSDLASLGARSLSLLKDMKVAPTRLHLALFFGRKVAPAIEAEAKAGGVLLFPASALFPAEGAD